MGFIKGIGYFFKIILFFLKMRAEKDKAKAEKQAEVGKVIVDAFKEVDPVKRDSAVVSAIDDINRL